MDVVKKWEWVFALRPETLFEHPYMEILPLELTKA